MSVRDLSKLYPDFKQRLLKIMEDMKSHGFELFIVETYRSYQTQDELLAVKATKAKGGQSYHNFGLACDLAFRSPEPYSGNHPWGLLGQAAKKQDCEWGGNFRSFPDRPHVQKTYGIHWSVLDAQFRRWDLAQVWRLLDEKRNSTQTMSLITGGNTMEKVKVELELPKELHEACEAAVAIIKAIKAKKSIAEIATDVLPKAYAAIDGIDKVPAEVKEDLKGTIQVGGLLAADIVAALLA